LRRSAPIQELAGLALLVPLLAVGGCTPQRDRTAAELYPKACARCHGDDGKGAPQQVKLYPKADLTASELRGLAGRRAIYRRIAEGYGPMPGFEHKLTQAEIESLVEFSVKLQAPLSKPQSRPTPGR
jgi:mono/diheme cytochrome c family protein